MSAPEEKRRHHKSQINRPSVKVSPTAAPGSEPGETATVCIEEMLHHADELEPTDIYGTGCFQVTILVCSQLASFTLLSQQLSVVLMSTNVNHWCKPYGNNTYMTTAEWKSTGIPSDAAGNYSQCTRYDPPLNEFSNRRTVVSCSEWDYETDRLDRSIVSEWDLVCKREGLISFVLSLHMSGAVAAVPIAGQFSDRIGRRPVICLSVIAFLASGFGALFAKSFALFLLLRFMVAACTSSIQITTFVLLFEVSAPQHRALYCTVFQVGWLSAAVFLKCLSWFYLTRLSVGLIVMIPTSLLICTFVMAEESPRWLLATWDLHRAEQVIMRAARINGVPLHTARNQWSRAKVVAQMNPDKTSYMVKATLIDLATIPVLRQRMLILLWCWFALIFSYYSFSYNQLTTFSDFLYFLAVSLLLPTFYASYLSMKLFGRRVTLATILAIHGGVTCILVVVTDEASLTSSALGVVAKCSLDASIAVLFTYTVELYPTVVRSLGLSTASMAGRVGGVFAPFTKDLTKWVHPSTSFFLLSAFTLSTAIAVGYLPETKSAKASDILSHLEKETELNEWVKRPSLQNTGPIRGGHVSQPSRIDSQPRH